MTKFRNTRRWVTAGLMALTCGLVTTSAVSAAESDSEAGNQLAQFYGFSGIELYKLDARAFSLVHADFDSDGRTDIMAVDNRASCLRLLRQRPENERTEARTARVNDLASDTRFEIRQISVDKQVAGLVTGDFNSDGRADVAYVGAPDSLVIRYQPEQSRAEWNNRWSVRLPDLAPAAWMIASGDLNGDKRDDIAVLGKKSTYIIYQDDDGKMQSPAVLINTSSQLSLLQIADLNGDGRKDLTYQANESGERGLCVRLQNRHGRLGPEFRLDMPQARAVTVADVDHQPGDEVLTIDARTGRVIVSQLKKATGGGNELPTRLVQYGIGDSSGREKRAFAVGDIDGDQRNDVVVTDPENAQLLVYRQDSEDGLGTAEAFPGLLGAIGVAVADVDRDGRNEVIVMSDKESAVAVSRFAEGRLVFPEIVAQADEGFTFTAMAVLEKHDRPILAICQKRGSGSSARVQLSFLVLDKQDGWQPLRKPIDLPPEALGTRGMSLLPVRASDTNTTELLLVPNGSGNKGVILLQIGPDDKVQTTSPLNLGIDDAGACFVDGNHLYVAREAFARKMTFTNGDWKIADQFNAGESRARLVGTAVLNLDGDEEDEIVLIDSGVRLLRILKKQGGLYRPWKEVNLGSLRFASSHVADLNADGHEDLLLFGNQRFSVLYSGDTGLELLEVASWESEREDAYPADIIAGDVNGDGAIDLTLIDTSIDGIAILAFDPAEGLKSATHFRVFEEKRLVSQSSSRGTEPREGFVADVTGDGRADLVLLCHDRLIVYPQDTGETSDSASP